MVRILRKNAWIIYIYLLKSPSQEIRQTTHSEIYRVDGATCNAAINSGGG